jgi:uncharacterized Zn finger protein
MPIRPCPKCQTHTARQLEEVSLHASVWYYRCQNCGHVWNVLKTDPDGPVRDVTIRPEQEK